MNDGGEVRMKVEKSYVSFRFHKSMKFIQRFKINLWIGGLFVNDSPCKMDIVGRAPYHDFEFTWLNDPLKSLVHE